jgi:Thymidylate synthase
LQYKTYQKERIEDMHHYTAKDVNQALGLGINYLLRHGTEENSRGGAVLVAPGPVCITYTEPRRRVLFSPTRDANPFFHLFESLWMLAGRNDIAFPCYFNSTYGQFSDDGVTMWDAYGWRWRSFFGWDQLTAIAEELKANPTSRRCVLSMWNASEHHIETGNPSLQCIGEYSDLAVATHGGKAVPCNTHCYFDLRGAHLNMTVMNRSNDAIWGAFGANAVHFSFLLEYMAMRVGVPIGVYRQFTNNLHAYTEKFSREKLERIIEECAALDALSEPGPMIEEGFDDDLALFMSWVDDVMTQNHNRKPLHISGLKTAFMHNVALPMFQCWFWRKQSNEAHMRTFLEEIRAPDWQRACREWIDRRKK